MSDVKKDIAKAERDVWETVLADPKDSVTASKELHALLAGAGGGAVLGGILGGLLKGRGKRIAQRGRGVPSLTGAALGGAGGAAAVGSMLPDRQFKTKRVRKGSRK